MQIGESLLEMLISGSMLKNSALYFRRGLKVRFLIGWEMFDYLLAKHLVIQTCLFSGRIMFIVPSFLSFSEAGRLIRPTRSDKRTTEIMDMLDNMDPHKFINISLTPEEFHSTLPWSIGYYEPSRKAKRHTAGSSTVAPASAPTWSSDQYKEVITNLHGLGPYLHWRWSPLTSF